MNWTGLDVFDNSIRRTNTWLKEFMQELNWTDRRQAALALCDVLQSVRNCLDVHAAVQFGDQLPLLIRGAYFEGWKPTNQPVTVRPLPDETLVKAVFRLLNRKADEGEIERLDRFLPEDLRRLWPPTLRAA
jgi:uncharacterized protein (DUF2267 family)